MKLFRRKYSVLDTTLDADLGTCKSIFFYKVW